MILRLAHSCRVLQSVRIHVHATLPERRHQLGYPVRCSSRTKSHPDGEDDEWTSKSNGQPESKSVDTENTASSNRIANLAQCLNLCSHIETTRKHRVSRTGRTSERRRICSLSRCRFGVRDCSKLVKYVVSIEWEGRTLW